MRLATLLFLAAPLLRAEAPEPLPERAAQEALAFAEAQSSGLPGQTTLRLLKPPLVPRLKEGDVRFEPSHLSKGEPLGSFFAVLRITVDGKPAGLVRVDMEGHWKGTVLRAKTSLARKTIPTADQWEETPFEGTPPPGALSEFPEGHRLRLALAPGKILTRGDLEPIPLVTTGERVRLTVACEELSISAEAVARNSGALGDRVKVELPTRKWITAQVTGPGEARAEWGSSR